MCKFSLFLFCILATLSLHGSQLQTLAYWNQMFAQAPVRFAYPASYFGVGEASHYLAEKYWREHQRARALSFYQRAVRQGDAGAAYALSVHVPAKSEQWLQAAAELGDREASLTIARRMLNTDPRRAYELLQALQPDTQRDTLMARILLARPGLAADTQWQDIAPDTEQWSKRRDVARRLDENPVHYGQQCLYGVNVYLQARQARIRLYDWLAEFYQHPFAQLDFCFTLIDRPEAAECRTDDARVDCWAREATSEYRWFVAEKGLANARANELHLSMSSSFEVLIHELGHWFGLADEYPMREPMASAFCEGRFRFETQNLVVTSSSLVDARTLKELEESLPWRDQINQPIATKMSSDLYRLGSDDSSQAGLFRAATCEATRFQAWKPVAEVTFMEQHDIGVVPPLYLRLIEQTTTQ
ncbi:hypothetical protein [Aliidiomarina soli]|uniref:Peptidase M43 pregnancy-associated plasma-A domain-containing protein n=1 Tax=Aliidiomarina soli TaxID=1928574 RepID=A0A432WLD1_9GAMM|nr:hypothetical protein [Aliidiomarina soli]RUO34541.1 hypothetical protein CWE14_00585 [Aliidiomarina soli]